MKKALDPKTFDWITVAEYANRYGAKLDAMGAENKRQPTLCPVCRGAMTTVSENSPGDRDAVFRHVEARTNPKTPWCILRESTRWKYEGLTPTVPDVARGRLIRQSFLTNWQKHWAIIKNRVTLPGIEFFISAIRLADKSRVWEHRDLQECLMPYILMSMLEFPPPVGVAANRRTHTERYRFGGAIRTYEDLWFKTTGEFNMIAVEYEPAIPPKRVATVVLDIRKIDINLDFLEHDIPADLYAHPRQVVMMQNAFHI
ncbi:MAG: hypothetical protein QM533_11595 [Cytophagales bacterium]|nr:hypothetical protein [Cytophagales bacterium]